MPCITVSGVIAEEMVLSTLRFGAQDYILKSNLTRLAPAVERELRSAESGRVRRRSESDLRGRDASSRAILDNLPETMVAVDQDGNIVMFNRAAERMFGYTAAEVYGTSLSGLLVDADAPRPRGRRRDGTEFSVELSLGVARPGEKPVRILVLREARTDEVTAALGDAEAALDALRGTGASPNLVAELATSISRAARACGARVVEGQEGQGGMPSVPAPTARVPGS